MTDSPRARGLAEGPLDVDPGVAAQHVAARGAHRDDQRARAAHARSRHALPTDRPTASVELQKTGGVAGAGCGQWQVPGALVSGRADAQRGRR
jgi:hypothetical protein